MKYILKKDITINYDITKISKLIKEDYKIIKEDKRVYAIKEVFK